MAKQFQVHSLPHLLVYSLPTLAALTLLAACGQVITLTPTPTPLPSATVAITLESSAEQPTPTPAPYTPEPTATPTITSTPVIHEIQSGESLLAIADEYNVSVAALQEINGILDPRTLQVGQQIIIPRAETLEDAANATPTPTPVALELQNVHFAETALDGLWVMGEALNETDGPLEQVRVGVMLVDENNVELAEAAALSPLDLVDAGERAPFAILFEDAPPQFDRYRTYLVSAVPAFVGSYYRDLEIRDLQGAPEGTAAYIARGRIFNFGPEEAVNVQVVLVAYDPLGRVIDVRKFAPQHNVVPIGGETDFTVVLAPVGGPVDRVEALAQGRRIKQ